MAEYIDREAAIKAIYDSDPNGIRRTLGFNVGQIEEALRAIPTADVAPVRHGKWISVKDRLPEPTYCVLVVGAYGEMEIDALGTDGEWMGMVEDVTHWMPLPKPPKGDADNG